MHPTLPSPSTPSSPPRSPTRWTRGGPVVALESTLLAHGLPRPDNRAAADDVEAAVRKGGAVPATIAVLDGVPHVGLTAAEVDRVCADPDLAKLGVRDLPVAAALGLSGATTVSSTALLAAASGIGVFATGGLGGVHRHASDTFDESADLTALSRTSLVVVCAGVKSILDVPATLERLESLSVTVIGYRTTTFPGSTSPTRARRWTGRWPTRRRRRPSSPPAARSRRAPSWWPTRCPWTNSSTRTCTTA